MPASAHGLALERNAKGFTRLPGLFTTCSQSCFVAGHISALGDSESRIDFPFTVASILISGGCGYEVRPEVTKELRAFILNPW
jgi:hypothetical protein